MTIFLEIFLNQRRPAAGGIIGQLLGLFNLFYTSSDIIFLLRTYLVVPELSKELDIWTARQGEPLMSRQKTLERVFLIIFASNVV